MIEQIRHYLMENTELLQDQKKCALCGKKIDDSSQITICSECMNCADCCIGLEKL